MVQQNKTQKPGHTQALLANESSRAMISLQPSLEIGGTYQLEQHIGEGGMGSVYSGRHMVLNRPCAIKFLIPDMISASSWQMFKNEAKILNSLNHEGICKIYDLGLHKNTLPFLAMELIDGITLDDYLERFGPLSTGATLHLAAKAARTFAYAHRHNILHRDIKPANIMLAHTSSNNVAVKILDFGISQTMAQDENAEGNNDIIGSAFYMSPEQFRGDRLTASSDIYSLGCTIFECLTGRPPYDAQEYSDLSEMHQGSDLPTLSGATGLTMSPDLEAIISHCLQKHTIKRYKSMSELAVDCENLLEGKSLQFALTDHHLDVDRGNIKFEMSESERKLRPAIVSSAALCVIVLCGMLYVYISKIENASRNKSSNQQIEVPTVSILSESGYGSVSRNFQAMTEEDLAKKEKQEEIAEETFIRGNQVIGTVRNYKGSKWWAFDFPAQLNLGAIRAVSENNKYIDVRMKGKLLIPANETFYIQIANPYSSDFNNALIKRFNPACAKSLTLSGPTNYDLEPLSRWKNLKQLSFISLPLTETMINQMGACKNVKYLSFSGDNLNAKKIARVMIGKPIEFLSLNSHSLILSVDVVINQAVRSPGLRYLNCQMPNSDESLKLINGHPKLKTIIFNTEDITKEQILNISNKCKDKEIAIDCDELSFPQEEQDALKKACKNINLRKHKYIPF